MALAEWESEEDGARCRYVNQINEIENFDNKNVSTFLVPTSTKFS